jgi:hypothetical protein
MHALDFDQDNNLSRLRYGSLRNQDTTAFSAPRLFV